MAVLGFVRGKVPADKAGQFDTALAKLGQTGPLPAGPPDLAGLADKTGLAAGQVGSLLETVMTFLKDKLPPDLVTTLTAAVSKGGLGGATQKVAGMSGRG